MSEMKVKIMLFISLVCMILSICFMFMNKMIVLRTYFGVMCSGVWVFQIIHNVRERNRKNPNIVYFIGTSAITLFYSLYQCCYPYNFYEYEPDITGAVIIVLIHAMSIIILIGQHKIKSRFFLPRKCWSEFNYIQQFENTQPSEESYVQVDTEENMCPICLEDIRYKPGTQDKQNTTYMLTPCQHKFHQECLSHWMLQKFECPKCRAQLPKIEI